MAPRITWNTLLQVGVATALVVVVYLLSMGLLQRDGVLDHEVARMRPTDLRVDVLRGYGNLSTLADLRWTTVNQSAPHFLPLLKSYNRRGGAQFTYSLWLRVNPRSGGAALAGRSLLLRGDRRMFKWRKHTAGDPARDIPAREEAFGPGVLIKCPHIRFGASFDELVVEYNTLGSPHEAFTLASSPEPGPMERRNALSLVQGRWAMLTFVFEDNVGISSFEEGIRVSVYLNDDLYYTHRQAGALRLNQGDLHLAPGFDRGNHDVDIGDVAYYNTALSPDDVAERFREGPPRQPTRAIQQAGDAEPLHLSEYNKLDVYQGSP